MSEWISVDDKLPEGKCIVWLEECISFNQMHTANYDGEVAIIAEMFSFDVPKVTHWRPLPEPPK